MGRKCRGEWPLLGRYGERIAALAALADHMLIGGNRVTSSPADLLDHRLTVRIPEKPFSRSEAITLAGKHLLP